MHIMFTDKLSKMVASTLRKFVNMISSDMIFETEHLFWQNTSWSSGEESIMDLLTEKTLSVTLNDINSRNEVRASVLLEYTS